ncbi:MAG: hypothetical protein O2829_02650 [Bacteroidetes bacterium]|nr:hypothetical protein [Bacteroidota bacterium]
MLLVATLEAPRFLSIHIFPVLGLITSPLASEGGGAITDLVKTHDFPPIFIAKLATPTAEGAAGI